jgi:DNA-binding transcriptional ArsR family regulator
MTNVMIMTDALSAAAEPTRRRILQLLARGPRTVSQIAGEFSVTRSAISQHLLLLAAVGLVEAEKVGRERHYRVLPSGLQQLQDEINRFWTDELDLLVADAHQLAQQKRNSS